MDTEWKTRFEQLPDELQTEIMRNEDALVSAVKSRSTSAKFSTAGAREVLTELYREVLSAMANRAAKAERGA